MQVIENRLGDIAADVSEMKGELRAVAAGMERVTRLEEGRSHHEQALGRAFEKLDLHDRRLGILESEQPMTKMVRGWVIAAVVSLVALLGMQVVSMSFVYNSLATQYRQQSDQVKL
jgi:hypothetical protein